MIKRAFRVGLWLGVLAALAAAWYKLTAGRRTGPADALPTREPSPWPPLRTEEEALSVPTPEPEPVPEPIRATDPWVVPEGGACPATHPVKAKLSSGIYHVPGGANYERTVADRCYPDPAAAEADGLRAAKR